MFNKKKATNIFVIVLFILFSCVIFSPILIAVFKSFNKGFTKYNDFFLWKPLYLRSYVNSIFISGLSSVFSVIIAVLASYVFAKKNFIGKNVLFFLYVIVMMMPFQVTLLPQYIVSKNFLYLIHTALSSFRRYLRLSLYFFLHK